VEGRACDYEGDNEASNSLVEGFRAVGSGATGSGLRGDVKASGLLRRAIKRVGQTARVRRRRILKHESGVQFPAATIGTLAVRAVVDVYLLTDGGDFRLRVWQDVTAPGRKLPQANRIGEVP
jgi:hypothetical protein